MHTSVLMLVVVALMSFALVACSTGISSTSTDDSESAQAPTAVVDEQDVESTPQDAESNDVNPATNGDVVDETVAQSDDEAEDTETEQVRPADEPSDVE